MWPTTRLTELLRVVYPILQAPRLARPLPAADLVRTLVEETERVIQMLGANA